MKGILLALGTRIGTAIAAMLGTTATLTPEHFHTLETAFVMVGLVGVDLVTEYLAKKR